MYRIAFRLAFSLCEYCSSKHGQPFSVGLMSLSVRLHAASCFYTLANVMHSYRQSRAIYDALFLLCHSKFQQSCKVAYFRSLAATKIARCSPSIDGGASLCGGAAGVYMQDYHQWPICQYMTQEICFGFRPLTVLATTKIVNYDC